MEKKLQNHSAQQGCRKGRSLTSSCWMALRCHNACGKLHRARERSKELCHLLISPFVIYHPFLLVPACFDWNQKLPCEWCRSVFGFSALLQQYLHSSRNPLIQRNLTVTSRLSGKYFTSFEGFFLPSVSKINLILNTYISFQPRFLCTKPLWKARVRLIAPTSHLFDLQCSAEPNKGLNYCSSIVEGQETHT